jgi:hypothetical protein
MGRLTACMRVGVREYSQPDILKAVLAQHCTPETLARGSRRAVSPALHELLFHETHPSRGHAGSLVLGG